MDRDQMDRIVNEHFGYEATDDVDGVLATLTDDVVHHVVGSPWGELVGKDAVRPFYEELFGDLKGDGVEPVARWYGEDHLVDETLWTGQIVDGRVFGLPGQSGRVTFRLLHVFEFRDGHISLEKVWSDIVSISEQLS
jgi:ketosteroid isomerase-like protein